jgi:hypothetical protein
MISELTKTCRVLVRLRKYSLTNEKWFFLFFMCNLGAYSGASLLKFPPSSQAIS